jgi:O-antigen ligase
MLRNLRNVIKLTFYEKLFLLFPIVLILRPLVINVFLILITFILIYEFYKKKYLYIFKQEIWISFFLLFIFYSISRGFFSTDAPLAVKSSVSLVRFLAFSLFIYLCIPNAKNLNIIIKFWTILLILLCIDTIIQYFFFKDIFGFTKLGIWRLTGPFDRPVIGAYLAYISIPIISYFFFKYKNFNFNNKILLFLICFFLFVTIGLTGERLSFIMFFSSLIVILFFNFRIKNFIYLLIIVFCVLLFMYLFFLPFNDRINQLYSTIIAFPESPWGRLYHSSYLVFKNNFFFGAGLKNYSIVCDNQIIDPLKGLENIPQFCSTHPHHLYLEILSESGILGFLLLMLTFGIFFTSIVKKIKKLKSNKVYKEYKGFLYGNILILLIYFWPIKTSGRFFTTWNGSFFWFNLGIALLITKEFYKKNK